MLHRVKRIFDPVHHFVELDDAEARLLDTTVMQRTRRLRQLGLAYLAYPSAEHSRFSHAIGALAMGTRVFEAVVRHGRHFFSSDGDIAYQRRLVRAALLLHDVGHGPFSHACEAVLGKRHEERTREILELPEMRAAVERLGVDRSELLALIVGDASARFAWLREMVSGPNLDSDRMDYLLRDAYFTGVQSGRYDVDQLVGSMRLIAREGKPVLGIDARGTVALESFVLARYMMFASVYFHHTTRMFEHILHDVLHELWPDPHALDPIDEFLQWDDFRVFNELRTHHTEVATALRERRKIYRLAAEFNGESDLHAFEARERELRAEYGDANVWADDQSQVLHRLPLVADAGAPTVWVQMRNRVVDARQASDLIAKLSGKAHWRKLFVRRENA